MNSTSRAFLCISLLAAFASALTPAEVLVVANRQSPVSRSIAEYYVRSRGIPASHVVYLDCPAGEEIERAAYESCLAAPISRLLRERGWVESVLAIVTTKGVPLKIRAELGPQTTAASVDSELAALYQDLHGRPHPLPGPLPNPYYRSAAPFRHPDVPIYLVTRLSAYTFADVRVMLERAEHAQNRGNVVLDMKSYDLNDGNHWLKLAAEKLPPARVRLEESGKVARGVKDVIGYAGWGSNDPSRAERDVQLTYLPGAIATEFVSTDGRTFEEPPPSWTTGTWENKAAFFAGSPQSLAADLIRQGATGASGHVYEPYLAFTPRPDFLFPAYLGGRNLAESFYAAIPAISWMNIVLGDPLCRLWKH
jgi:uncharacterized protein (TIGR03790 family)